MSERRDRPDGASQQKAALWPGERWPLEAVLATAELPARAGSGLDTDAEQRALTRIAASMNAGPRAVLAEICELAMTLCDAQSAGLSVLRDTPAPHFSWDVLAGRFAPFTGGTAPRHDSPCGVALDRRAPQLFRHPEQHFPWKRAAGMPIVEGLVVPLIRRDCPLGSLWVMKHEPGPGFSSADAATMTLLAGHVCAALDQLDSVY